MARVTVEDCVEVVHNRFELVALASQRTKDIASGARLTIDRDNDKNAVVALREIADRTVDVAMLREAIIQGSQRFGRKDVIAEDDAMDEGRISEISSEEILEEIGSMGVADESDLDDGVSFSDENLDVED